VLHRTAPLLCNAVSLGAGCRSRVALVARCSLPFRQDVAGSSDYLPSPCLRMNGGVLLCHFGARALEGGWLHRCCVLGCHAGPGCGFAAATW
jgi:hypothetical protein